MYVCVCHLHSPQHMTWLQHLFLLRSSLSRLQRREQEVNRDAEWNKGRQRGEITEKLCFLLSLFVARCVCQIDPSGCFILYRWFKLVCCSLRLLKTFQHIMLCWCCMAQGLSWWLAPLKWSSVLHLLTVIHPTEVSLSKTLNSSCSIACLSDCCHVCSPICLSVPPLTWRIKILLSMYSQIYCLSTETAKAH